MNTIQDAINAQNSEFGKVMKDFETASNHFVRKTTNTRNYTFKNFETCKKVFDDAGDLGLLLLLLSKNAVASNNELDLLSNITPQESLLVMGAYSNLAQDKDIEDGLPTLSDTVKALAYQHMSSTMINALQNAKYSDDMAFPFEVSSSGKVAISPIPEPEEED